MKKIALGLSLLSALVSATALSAPTANIKVTGDIKPPTCTVNGLAQNDVIFDFGQISPSLIPQSTNYQYPSSFVKNSVTISCDSDTYLTFQSSDTYDNGQLSADQYNSGWFYFVNKSDIKQTVGATAFIWEDTFVDGKSSFISRANDVPITGTGTTYNNALYKGATNGWTSSQQTSVDLEKLDLVYGKIFQVSFRSGGTIKSFILSKDALAANGVTPDQGVDFIGEAVLTFNFGV